MKILKWLVIVIVILALLLLGFLAYMGFFSKVEIVEKEMGPYIIAYESYTGEYKNTGAVFEKVYQVLKSAGIETKNGLGIYYDDPSKVAPDKLRSDCGTVIELKDIKTVPKSLKIKILPKKMSMTAEFPLKNVLSYTIGPMKAYPKLMQYAQDKGYKIDLSYEYYDMGSNKILFIMVIGK